MEHYKRGTVLTYIPHKSEVVVVWDNLAAGGSNADSAIVVVKTKNGILIPVPFELQDQYLTKEKPKLAPWKRILGNKS